MRIRVRHTTTYRYDEPARFVVQRLLLTPRNDAGQRVRRWRVEVDRDCRLREREDAYGNLVHSLSVDGPIDSIATSVDGEVETFATGGVVQGMIERLPPELYLRQTKLTTPDDALKTFGAETATRTDRLDRLHALCAHIFETMTFDVDATNSGTSAAEAFAAKRGVCQDFAGIFLAVARSFGAPARYVGGYLLRQDGQNAQVAGHAWAEAYVDNLGWVGFDPAHSLSPDEAYVRVAIGLDSLDAAPVRGSRVGGGSESLEVRIQLDGPAGQSQSQS